MKPLIHRGTARGALLAGATALSIMTSGVAAADNFAVTSKRIDYARKLMMVSPRKAGIAAENAAREAGKLSPGNETSNLLATANWLRAEAALRLNDIGSAHPLVNTAFAAVGDAPSQLRGDILLTRGSIYGERGEIGPALRDYQAAFRNFQRTGNNRGQAISLMLIASLYGSGKDYKRSLGYFTQATEIYNGDPGIMVALHNNRGGVLQDLREHAAAEKQFALALRYAEKMRSPVLIAQVLRNMARNRLKANRVEAAEDAVRRSLAIAASAEAAATWRPQLLALAAEAALQRANLEQASDLIDETFTNVDPSTTEPAWLEPHITAYRVYARQGRYGLAFRHLAAVKRIEDAATTLATNTSNALMAARFDFANQELRIAKLKAEELRRSVALAQARTQFQQTIFLGLGGATAIVIAILGVSLFSIRRSRNQLRVARDGLAETNVALNKALAAKTEFLATTSHEIRTPLNGILGMTQVMLADPRLDSGTRDRLGVVRGAGLTMRALVDDILDVAKMETGNLTLEEVPYDLAATITDASRLWEEQARAAGLEFHVELPTGPTLLIGDAARIRQIVFNLLSNAVKFTACGSITLSATMDAADGTIAIAVADTGVGIPLDKQEAVFESFRQADASTTRTHGGTGLGLAICRNLAANMGGRITVDSVPGEGSRFTVTLPLRPAQTSADTATADVQPPALLILDRSPINRSMLRTLLERRAGRLIFAADVATALDLLATDAISRVLIDDATLCTDPEPDVAAERLAAAAGSAETTLLWSATRDGVALVEPAVTRVVAKPVAGRALAAALFGEGCDERLPSMLVSRAA